MIAEVQNEPIEEQTSTVEMVFLHASPNILKDFDLDRQKFGSNVPPPLDFKKEQWVIKQTLIDSGYKIKFKARVATKEAFQKTIFDAPQVLHISCHGTAMARM